jgi:hypothetical protein
MATPPEARVVPLIWLLDQGFFCVSDREILPRTRTVGRHACTAQACGRACLILCLKLSAAISMSAHKRRLLSVRSTHHSENQFRKPRKRRVPRRNQTLGQVRGRLHCSGLSSRPLLLHRFLRFTLSSLDLLPQHSAATLCLSPPNHLPTYFPEPCPTPH